MQSLISVIVPVYNTEKYLDRCIQSVLAQTYTNWELLLIDDGSTDSSGAICDKYAEQDSRIKVFHKENGGASSARNLGLDNAKGEWITFVDSDDWIDPTMYQYLIRAMIETECDISMCGVSIESIDTSRHVDCDPLYENRNSLHCIEMLEGPVASSSYNKLIKKSLINEKAIRYDTRLGMWDDLWVVIRLRYFASKITVVNGVYYHYRVDTPASITKQTIHKKVDSQLLCAKLLETFFTAQNEAECYNKSIQYLKFHAKDPLFDKKLYKKWKGTNEDTHKYIHKFGYGKARVIRYYLIVYGGGLGRYLLMTYDKIKKRWSK